MKIGICKNALSKRHGTFDLGLSFYWDFGKRQETEEIYGSIFISLLFWALYIEIS